MIVCRSLPLRLLRRTCSLILCVSAASALAHGQAARASASRPADLVVYGGYTFSQPDWGLAGTNDNGFMGGAAYTRFVQLFGHEIGVGVEARYDHVTGPTVNEGAFDGGLHFEKEIVRKVHLYGGVGLGYGVIKFNYVMLNNPNYTQDNGTILYGEGGINYDVYRNFAIKVDYQFQNWTLGQNETIDPSVYSFGVQYRIPFRAWVSHGHERD